MPKGTRGSATKQTIELAKRNSKTYTGSAVNKVASAFASPDKKRAIALGTKAGKKK